MLVEAVAVVVIAWVAGALLLWAGNRRGRGADGGTDGAEADRLAAAFRRVRYRALAPICRKSKGKGQVVAAVAVGGEQPLGQVRVRASAAQAQRLLEWAAGWPERTWAVEGGASGAS